MQNISKTPAGEWVQKVPSNFLFLFLSSPTLLCFLNSSLPFCLPLLLWKASLLPACRWKCSAPPHQKKWMVSPSNTFFLKVLWRVQVNVSVPTSPENLGEIVNSGKLITVDRIRSSLFFIWAVMEIYFRIFVYYFILWNSHINRFSSALVLL